MKWRLSSPARWTAAALAIAGIAGHAELARWVQDIASPSRLDAVFFRPVSLPTGAVEIRRPPKETRAELAKLIAATPSDADLYALRAREDEQQLDFSAAENDWKKAAQLASNKSAAALDLADYYHRRIRPNEEIEALQVVTQAPTPASERWTPAAGQQSWKAFERILTVIHEQALPASFSTAAYRSWIARYPKEAAVYRQYLQYLVDSKQFDATQALIASYRTAFPNDSAYPIQAAATVAWRRGSLDDAIRIYDQSFRPPWPAELVKSYFDLLKESHGLRRYLEDARRQIAAKPVDLAAASRVFYYYQQQGNMAAAQRALLEFRLRKESQKSAWSADELQTLEEFFEAVNNFDEAARTAYAMYSVPGASAASQEKALGAIATLLLSAPEQSIRLGAGDLSLYSDIAQLDPGPGFLNGVLSLLLNSTSPESHYTTDDAASVSYFHRAKAAELIRLYDSRFPSSEARASLHARLIAAYSTYGDNDAVVRFGREFLASFPKSTERVQVAITVADAYARQNQPQQEFALYDDLLKELAAQADGAPIGDSTPVAAPASDGQKETTQVAPARSPEYARVLDRYVSRLVALRRVRDALALYRREIDRNPNDPGLYERLAAFLEENKMGADVELVYRRAMSQFSGGAWTQKLARFYLRQKQTAQFDKLTQDVVKIFSGSELESFLRESTSGQAVAPLLYRQVNLYAHQRFPHDLTFVRNLLNAYTQKATGDPVASEALLRRYWFYASDLRNRFFETLSRTKKLDTELAALKAAPANSGTEQFLAEAGAWRSHFEDAAPLLQTLAAEFPADADRDNRASSLFRSLATYDAAGDLRNTRIAAGIAQNLTRAEPSNSAALTRLGEIYADRELYSRAKPSWDRIPRIQPGVSNGYLESAAIFWDYFQFDDALRLIEDGRKKLSDPALFAYEAGAIHENRREYSRAVNEYLRGALASETSQARTRLIQLAKRPRDRDAIEQFTAKEVAGANPTSFAVSLRVDILSAENRRADLEQFLISLADRTSSLELLAYLQQTATRSGFEKVQEHSMLREIALLTDPVERISERLTLARFHEGRHDTAAAKGVMAALYMENPTTLGVIRATVDFDWRNNDQRGAIDVLLQAAAAGQPSYRKDFTFEAARKATDAGDYSRARTLLAGLLKDAPFNADYLAATSDAFAREGNDAGLRDFYNAKMKEIASAKLSAADRIENTAALRRGLIPVLTRLKDYTGAMDQYIEIVNRYPEDEGLVRDAALYAAAHQRSQQLTAYYAKTEQDSPKDYRWPMTLARIQTTLEDFPSAITEYQRASTVRPDRVDLFTARASLEERLFRFDEAAATYAKLYELNYHNSQWMEKVAEIRARQGRTDEAVLALSKAVMEGKPQRPEVFFAMATQLESWGILAPARDFAEKGVAAAGADLLTDFSSGAQLYARLMTRSRAYETAFKKLISLIQDPAGKALEHPEIDASLRQIGSTAADYFTPEEKLALEKFLSGAAPKASNARIAMMTPIAENARLADLQVKWRNQTLLAAPGQPAQTLIDMQQKRLRYDELAAQLEAYWKVFPPNDQGRDALLTRAAENYRLAGSTNAELRVLAQLDQRSALNGTLLARYAELLARTPQRFTAAAASDPSEEVRNSLANYALENYNAARALEVVAARGKGMPAVWTRAYTGLTGLYFADPAPKVGAAFHDALGAVTIGERLGKPADHDLQLVGDPWFYYASRYGEYLDITKQRGAEDYLPGELEAAPAQAGAYFKLAEYYRESGQTPRAITDYENALQLDSNRADVHDRLARIYWQQNKHEHATRELKTALQDFAKLQDERRLPEDFWRSLAATLDDVGAYKVLPVVRPEADRVLRTYVRRNGSYQVDLLLRSAVRAAGDPVAGVAWVVDLSRAAPDSSDFLSNLVKSSWIPEAQRPGLYEALIESSRQKLNETFGEARGFAETELRRRKIEWAEYLVDQKQPQAAKRVLADFSTDDRQLHLHQIVPLEVRIAAQDGTLQAYLDRFAKDSTLDTPLDDLERAATDLREHGEATAIRQVLEFVYTRQLELRQLNASTFLGLAEIRLQQGNVTAAVALLKRMTLVSAEPFQNLAEAAALLDKNGHPAEALPFAADLVRATPWDQTAQVALGRIRLAAAQDRDGGLQILKAAAESSDAPYAVRVTAAQAIGEAKGPTLATASQELNLLSGPAPIAPASAEKPYFYTARLVAAAQSNDPAVKIRLLRDAAAIDPAADEPKFRLFDVAYNAKRYQTALGALASLLTRGGFALQFEANEPENAPGQIVEDAPENRYYTEQFLSGAELYHPPGRPLIIGMDPTRRALYARELADSYSKLNMPHEAATYYRIALNILPSDAEAKTQLNLLRAQLQRQRANRQRRPIVSANLEQDHVVRPRLSAAGTSGGVQ